MNRPRYLRFVTTRRHRDSGASEGLFAAAYDLRRAGAFAVHEALWFQQTVGWFERHVKAPKRVDLDLPYWSKQEDRVVWWWHAEAATPIRHMRHLATMLREHGVVVRVLRSAKPRLIVYDDDVQVGAIPFRDGVR